MLSVYVVCLLNILANFSNLVYAYRQTCGPSKSSLIWVHSLQKWLLKTQADDKADDNCCDWQFKG